MDSVCNSGKTTKKNGDTVSDVNNSDQQVAINKNIKEENLKNKVVPTNHESKNQIDLKSNSTSNVVGENSDESNWSNIEWLSKMTGKTVTSVVLTDFKGIGQVSDCKKM